MQHALQLSITCTLRFGLLALGLLFGISSAASAAPTYVANITNAPVALIGPTPLVRSSHLDQSEGRHGAGTVSAGSALTASIETSKGVSGFNNGIFTTFDGNLASFYDDIVITGPAAPSIPLTMHVPFRATYTQSWDSLTLPQAGFTDFSVIGQQTDLRARLGSPTFGFTEDRLVLSLNDKENAASVTLFPFNLGIQSPLASLQPGPSPGAPTTETLGGITIIRNAPLDAGGFLHLYRVQTPITTQGGTFGPGAGFHFDDVVTLSGQIELPGIAQVGVPMTLDLTLSANSTASGGFQLSSAGAVNVLHNFGVPQGGVPVFDLPAGYTVNSPSLGIANNTVTTFVGNLPIRNYPNTGVINVGSVTSVSGDLDISGNTGATVVDVSSVTTIGGDLDISNNPAAGVINVGSATMVGGDLDISGNTGSTVINVGGVTNVSGDLTIVDNGTAVVNANSNVNVSGDLSLQSTGTGVFNVGQAGGDLDLGLSGYSQVNAQTAAGQTAVTMVGGAAKMEMVLPDGAFTTDHVPFSVKQLAADPANTWSNTPTATLAKYEFDFAITTLNQDGTLNFQINLADLDPSARSALLDLLHANTTLTLGVQGDEPGAALQLFTVIGSGMDPSSGSVVVRWLDDNGADLVPYGGIDPSIIRFESLVGHFSTYSIVALTVPEPASVELLLIATMTLCLSRWLPRFANPKSA